MVVMEDGRIMERLATLEALASSGATERHEMKAQMDKAIILLQLLATDMAVHKGKLGLLLWMATTMGAVVGFLLSNLARLLGKGG
jgi:hypothetical protein